MAAASAPDGNGFPDGDSGDDEGRGDRSATAPGGSVYDWYIRGRNLLDSGDAAAASQLLQHAADAEPASRSVREALARALYDAGRYDDARAAFGTLVAADPADDYAQFGLGLACGRVGAHREAVEHLALAVAMRPELPHYARALRRARAALGGR